MKKILSLGCMILVLFSCKKDLEPGGTSAEAVANEWWVTFKSGGVDVYNLHHFKLSTYNTAANNDSIWIDDLKHSWEFKVKAKADFNNLTFNATQSVDEYHQIKVDITDGKVIKDGGRSKTGNTTDSIHMTVKFSDDPRTWTISGHARTRFAEDEY